jgi:chaperonin GroES
MKCPIIPLGDRVVLLPIDEGEQQYGSIIVPDMGQEKPEMGKVLAVGEGRVTNDGAIIRKKPNSNGSKVWSSNSSSRR